MRLFFAAFIVLTSLAAAQAASPIGPGSGAAGFSCDVNTNKCTCVGAEDGADCRAMDKNCAPDRPKYCTPNGCTCILGRTSKGKTPVSGPNTAAPGVVDPQESAPQLSPPVDSSGSKVAAQCTGKLGRVPCCTAPRDQCLRRCEGLARQAMVRLGECQDGCQRRFRSCVNPAGSAIRP